MRAVRKFLKKHHIINSILVGIAIITFWRGVWNLLDMYLFPENAVLSNWTSIAIGLLILFINDFRLKEIE